VRTWVASAPAAADDPLPAASGTVPPALEVEALRVEIPVGPERTTVALDGIDATVRSGEMLGVLGSNGAGKSTLARVLCGFETATAGRVRIGGADATGWSLAERGERIGFVLQEPGQMLSQPQVLDEIALGLRARGLPEEEIARRSEEVLEVCGLRPFRSWPLSALSHGQRKRVSIAAVLALEPEVLLLDEPTAGQDHAHYSEFMEFLRGVHRAGTTVVLITHDMHLALEYTRRVLVLSGGHLLADDHPAAVLTDPELSARADLVTTGLYDLARRCGVLDPAQLVRRVIAADRRAREEAR
jgi:energy-coupling factor transporter ATP-binding protein EcfA2